MHAQATFVKADASTTRTTLDELVSSLDNGDADVDALKRLVLICIENAVSEPSSPSASSVNSPTPATFSRPQSTLPLGSSIWEQDKTFERLFKALMKYLEPARVQSILCLAVYIHLTILQDEEELLYGLIVAWEFLENQTTYLDGKEGELFSMILKVRYCNKINVRTL